jgi:hypothetical protein
MSYTALDLLQALGDAHATAQMAVKTEDDSYTIFIQDGHITNVHGCPISELFQRLTKADPRVEVLPLRATISQPIRTKITSFTLEQAHLHDQNSHTMAIPTEEASGSPPHSAQAKLDSQAKRRTVNTLRFRTPEEEVPTDIARKELVFHRGHSYEVTIGRASECDFVSLHASVSRQHCTIRFDGEHFLVRDLGSKNGTRLNGKEITEAEARVRDVLHLGSEMFVLGVDSPPAEAAPAAAS